MPDGAWLGLHVTVDIGGRCKFGPDIEWIPEIDYSFEPEKLAKFLGFIRTYYPGLNPDNLHADYTGIRPKLYREGEPVPDFMIHGPKDHGMSGFVGLFGIESPGLTSALAIGEHVAGLLRIAILSIIGEKAARRCHACPFYSIGLRPTFRERGSVASRVPACQTSNVPRMIGHSDIRSVMA